MCLYQRNQANLAFEKGGVCVGSPMAGIHRFEQQNGLPRNYINVAM